jgi:isopentenyldiphosphate isomerase
MAAGAGVKLTDPRELLEVYDAVGNPTGRAKARGPVHIDGDWHLAFFCWIARRGVRGIEVLLQHRAARKDVWPLRFDASAAGHVRFGESMAEAAREVREELGIRVELSDLIALGRHRQQHDHVNGLIDREHHALHLLTPGPPDAAYQPDPREVAGLAWIALGDLLALVDGSLAAATVRYRAVDAPADAFVDRTLTAADLVPYADGYHRRLAKEIRRHVTAE